MPRPRRPFAYNLLRGVLVLAALVAAIAWMTDDRPGLPADHPRDSLRGVDARVARFAEQARHAVLPRSTFTVHAPTPELRLLLWRHALARTAGRIPIAPDTPEAAEARYVIALGSFKPPEPDLRFVVRFEDGSVWTRGEDL